MRLIILENNVTFARYLTALAEHCGHRAEAVVGDVQSALDVAIRTRPDAVIADVDLGHKGGGIQAAVLIHDATRIKTIFVATRFDSETRDRAQHAWPLALLTKPIEPKSFAKVLAGAAGLVAEQRRSSAAFNLSLAS